MRAPFLVGMVLLVAAWASPAAAQETHMTNSSGVNLREEPSLGADIVFRLPYGTRCTRLERKGRWVRVRISGDPPHEGWVHKNLLGPVRFEANRRDRQWMDLARHPEKGLKAPVRLEDIPCEDTLDADCVEDYRNRYYIERRNALERWIYWDDEAPFDARSELWAILGGPYTPYDTTPPEILNASPFAHLPAQQATHAGATSSYRVDIHGARSKGLECAAVPEARPSFFIELPERFAVARGHAHGGIIDFTGSVGSDELRKVIDVYFPKDSPFEFETSDRYVSQKEIPFAIYDLESGTLERNAGRPVFVPSRNMFMITDLAKERPTKRPVLVFYAWIEIYLDQIVRAKAVKEVTLHDPRRPPGCEGALFSRTAFDFDGDHTPDVLIRDAEKQGACGYRRKDTYVNVDGEWRGFVNSYEAWCDDSPAETTPEPTPLPF